MTRVDAMIAEKPPEVTPVSDTVPTRRLLGRMHAWCSSCRETHLSGLADDDVAWTASGFAVHVGCGSRVVTEVGGWTKELRSTCQGCGDPLKGRQTTWCSRKWQVGDRSYPKICFVAWRNPQHLYRALAERQHGLCGICIGPLDQPRAWPSSPSLLSIYEWVGIGEVDHLLPLAAGGPRTVDNLRASHRACNQRKKDRPLRDTRLHMGITARVEQERVADLPELVSDLLLAKDTMAEAAA